VAERVLITGVGGFIGQALSERLSREQVDGEPRYELYGLYEPTRTNIHKGTVAADNKWVADLRDVGRLKELMEYVRPNVVIHLAAKTEVAHSFDNFSVVSEVNYVGTVNLVETWRRTLKEVDLDEAEDESLPLFVFASTMETYGFAGHRMPFTEETEQFPAAPYAVAKVAAEQYIRYMERVYDLPYTIIRQTNAYGRRDNDFFVVERILSQMMRGEPVVKLGAPWPWRNFLYIDDLIDLYQSILDRRLEADGQVFVTGPDNAIAIEHLATLCQQVTGWDGEIEWHTQPRRPGEVPYLNSVATKAKHYLGWEPRVELLDGLERTAKLWAS
jgi:nucleoside-diphosphate-sugar epimerase